MGTQRIHTAISRVATIITAAFIVVACLGPVGASAASTGAYSVRPVEIDQNDPATRAYFKPALKPGASTTLHVEITNRDDTPLKLRVDAVDGVTGQTSGAVYANRQDPVRKAGAWVTPATHELELAARGIKQVSFTVVVPSGAEPGDHLAGIAFENEAVQSSGSGFSVKEIIREVVGIQIRVPGPASTHLSIGALALQSLPGTAFASVIVHLSNDGQLLCKPALTVALHGPNGSARTVTRQLDTILPGDSIPYPLAWPDALPKGTYSARASTTSCGPATSTADVPLALGAPLNGTQQTTSPAHRTSGMPVMFMGLALGVAVVGLLLGLLIGNRRRRGETIQPAPVPVRRVRLADYPVATAPEGSELRPASNGPVAGDQVKRLEPSPEPDPSPQEPQQQSLWP
jgi:hypothetical protein